MAEQARGEGSQALAGGAGAQQAEAAAAQWAQALAARGGQGAPAFLPPAQLAAYYAANAAQFAQAYNAQLMAAGGMAGLANPYAFVQQAQAMARSGSQGGLPPAAPGGREQQDGSALKRQRRDRSSSDTRADGADGSRFSGSQSPASEPGSEARVMPGGDGSEAAGLGASASVHSLAGAGGLQDEREVKKLRRKQSNRESARRSRLRKQAECEALSGRVGELQAENARLRETNRQLLSRVEELVAKLEQRAAPGKVSLASDGGAFTPVGVRQPAMPAMASDTAAGSTEPAATAVKQEPSVVAPEGGTAESAAQPGSAAAVVAAAAEDAGCGVCVGDSCPAG